MARKSYAIDLVNQYIIDNFRPFAWCHQFGTTEPDQKTGIYFFHMTVVANAYDRPTLPSANNLLLPELVVENNYTIFIPLVSGSTLTKNGKTLDKDPVLKFRYCRELSENVIRAIDKLDPRTTWSHIDSSSEVFGTNKHNKSGAGGWEKVMAYEAGLPRKYWSFLSRKSKEEYEKQIIDGQRLYKVLVRESEKQR